MIIFGLNFMSCSYSSLYLYLIALLLDMPSSFPFELCFQVHGDLYRQIARRLARSLKLRKLVVPGLIKMNSASRNGGLGVWGLKTGKVALLTSGRAI